MAIILQIIYKNHNMILSIFSLKCKVMKQGPSPWTPLISIYKYNVFAHIIELVFFIEYILINIVINNINNNTIIQLQ